MRVRWTALHIAVQRMSKRMRWGYPLVQWVQPCDCLKSDSLEFRFLSGIGRERRGWHHDPLVRERVGVVQEGRSCQPLLGLCYQLGGDNVSVLSALISLPADNMQPPPASPHPDQSSRSPVQRDSENGGATLEVTQGQILSQSPTDATRFWWHLYGSELKKPSICPWVAFRAGGVA